MFLYWDGYEIDGSDTAYDIILPENVQISEFIDRFLSIPIICKKTKPIYNTLPARSFNRGHVASKDRISKSVFKERLLSGDYSEISIMVNCLYPEELPAELRAQLYALSENRKPHEEAYGKVENPCTAPANKAPFMSVDLTIGKLQEDWDGSDFVFEGSKDVYRYNFPTSVSAKKGDTCVTLGIPVSSTYEYAMYIVKHMEEHFPSITIWGGVECSCGATFATSLYEYEKIQHSINYSIKNTLKRLTEYGIVRSCILYCGRKWKTKYSKSGFYLKGREKDWYSPPKKDMPFGEYLELAELALSMDLNYFEQIFKTAVSIGLPPPDFYAGNPAVVKILEEKLEEAVPYEIRKTWYMHDWLYLGYVAFATVSGKPVCEFRIRRQMKEYLFTLLELAENGSIDFIKAETYKWRNE